MENNDKVIKLGRYISISDAAFFDGTNETMVVEVKVKPGYYIAWSEQTDFGKYFGERTGKLMACHNKFLKRLDEGTTEFYWEHIGNFGVDSATAAIYTTGTCPFTEDYSDSEDAFSCRTGIGDGYYPVYACIEKKQVVGIMVDFTFDDEEDQNED
jgi:hypothetical protein